MRAARRLLLSAPMLKPTKKLKLSHETVRNLSTSELANVGGGGAASTRADCITDTCTDKIESKIACPSLACDSAWCTFVTCKAR